jgi:glycosyltransferase involved in cell wall biosynthesis
MLGPIHPIEGFVPLLKAFAEVGKEADDWCVVLAGKETGEWRKILEASVRRKGESDRVMIVPAPDVATQRAWLARASALASPSLHVRCPVSVMQGVAAGIPVLASRNVVPPGSEGVVQVCGTSRDALREGLRRLFALSDAQRAELRTRSRDFASATFDWSVVADAYVQLYRGLL